MKTNPSVNRDLEDKAMNRIDHALGRPVWPLRETYRAYFATDHDSEQARDFAASPHWELRNVTQCGMAFYVVTDAGRQALADHLVEIADPHRAFKVTFEGQCDLVPAKSAGQARYRAFLRWTDGWDMSFRAFLARSSVRAAA